MPLSKAKFQFNKIFVALHQNISFKKSDFLYGKYYKALQIEKVKPTNKITRI
jgi:hypothetical protein